ncbi:MAG: hypothetical protein QOF04_2007 [Solirubrobacteraceae bacterium]|jgi:hypothetical protein|nr:hypothetical protein [Solirubrobacteraceae bacterium]
MHAGHSLGPAAPLTLAGWALLGLGPAAIAPAVLGAAAEDARLAPSAAIAALGLLVAARLLVVVLGRRV